MSKRIIFTEDAEGLHYWHPNNEVFYQWNEGVGGDVTRYTRTEEEVDNTRTQLDQPAVRCPKCGGPLETDHNSVRCPQCQMLLPLQALDDAMDEPGYYYLKNGEIIQEGDEVGDYGGKWYRTDRVGETMWTSAAYRRRIEHQKDPPQPAETQS